jgi:hypothetical protein
MKPEPGDICEAAWRRGTICLFFSLQGACKLCNSSRWLGSGQIPRGRVKMMYGSAALGRDFIYTELLPSVESIPPIHPSRPHQILFRLSPVRGFFNRLGPIPPRLFTIQSQRHLKLKLQKLLTQTPPCVTRLFPSWPLRSWPAPLQSSPTTLSPICLESSTVLRAP